MKIISFNQKTGLMSQGKTTPAKPQPSLKALHANLQFGHERREDSFQRIATPSRTPRAILNPQEREALITSILEDLTAAPRLQARLTGLRTEQPLLQAYSEDQPQDYIQALRDIIELYQTRGENIANRAVDDLLEVTDLTTGNT